MKSFGKKSNSQRVGTASARMWKERTVGETSTSPPKKSMELLSMFLVTIVVVSTFMSVVQMHLLSKYGIDMPSPDASSPMAALQRAFAPQIQTLSKLSSDDEISNKGSASPSKGDDEVSKKRPASQNTGDDNDECETIDEPDEDLKPILKILCQGGYDISKTSKEIDRSKLPKFSQILDFYGPPKVLGLETCATFREKVPAGKRIMAPAGMFNTGTNLLAHMMQGNCEFDDGVASMRWQVPWGKHMPFELRHNVTVKRTRPESVPRTLPVLMVRDPYTWMQSMCKQPYAAQFSHEKATCPNIVPYESDMNAHPRFRKMKYIPIHLKYSKEREIYYKYESMPGLYNNWYGDYIKVDNQTNQMKSPTDFPFLAIRMEDLVFHASTVVPQMCECVGGKARKKLRMTSQIANRNSPVDTSSGLNSGLSRSIIKYGNITRRRDQYPTFQLKAAKEALDGNLMKLLRYPYEEP